ncbi:MAG: HlyD family efflux transporter periplasmic adaptor subunit [Oscillospiraceae bacterium]|nr:HlyD family efflux transporter periplasmic adaptor subunit [Oscillospiraceae bacterium]
MPIQLPKLQKKKTDSPFEETAESKPVRRTVKKRPIIIAAGVALLAAVFLLGRLGKSGQAVTISLSDTSVLLRSDLQNLISATGTVESASSMMVYSTVNYTVQEVLVEVGDYVEEGQLLAKLDDQHIQDQIDSQEASLSVTGGTSAASVAAARDNYEQFRDALNEGLNPSILSAESAVTNAYTSYTNAVTAYDRYKEGLDTGENATLLGQDTALRNARAALESAQETYYNAQDALTRSENDIRDAQDDLREAQDDLAEAEDDLDDAEDDLDRAERQLKNLGNGYSSDISRLEMEMSALQGQMGSVEDPMQQAQMAEQLAEMQREMLSLSEDQRDYATDQAELTQDVSKLTQEVAQLTSKVSQLEASVKSYENVLKQAEYARDNCEQQVTAAERNMRNSEESYAAAITQYNATVTTVDQSLADYAKAVETSYEAYQTAQTNLEAAKVSAQNQLQSYRDNLNSAYAGSNKAVNEVSLRQLRADLADTNVTAPVSGTVTAVYAEVGSAGAGLLFVIEDIDNLVVSTSVKDYDVGVVKTGMPVTIKSDSTGDQIFDGEIASIAPTADKTPAGAVNTSGGDVSFATDVNVLSQDSGLRIGMSVRLNFVVDEAKNVMSVPYEAVYENAGGEKCVLAAVEQEENKYLLVEYPVTTGMENDLDIVVEGKDLQDGMRVVSEPSLYVPYAGQVLEVGAGLRSNNPIMMGGF